MKAASVSLDAPLRNHLDGMSRIMMLSDSSATIPEFSIAAHRSEVEECFVITLRFEILRSGQRRSALEYLRLFYIPS